jgi:magnesium chelatase subunit D
LYRYTSNKFVSSGMAEKLAQKACGKYYYLPNGGGGAR